MSRLFIIALFTIVHFSNSFSQNENQFDLNDSKWVSYQIYPTLGPGDRYNYWEVYIKGDTLIESKRYKLVASRLLCISSPQNGSQEFELNASCNEVILGGLRKDSSKVYFYKFKFASGSNVINRGLYSLESYKEHLLYDFSVEVGDTIRYSNSEISVIKSKSIINGVIHLSVNNSTTFDRRDINTINEISGSSGGLFAPYYSFLKYRQCFIPDYKLPHDCIVCNENIGDICQNSSTSNNETSEGIEVIPNPNYGTFGVYSLRDLYAIRIYNWQGELVYEEININQREKQLELILNPGIYIVHVTEGQNIKIILMSIF